MGTVQSLNTRCIDVELVRKRHESRGVSALFFLIIFFNIEYNTWHMVLDGYLSNLHY